MKTVWNQPALDVLRAETNVFYIDDEEVRFTYDDHEYAPWRYVHNNDELLAVVREIATELYADYKETDCLDIFPAALLPFVS